MVEWSGASRGTVRESLRDLAAENLLQITPGRGAVVASLSTEEVQQIYAVRAALEELAGQECARNATDAEIEAVREAYETFKSAVDTYLNTVTHIRHAERAVLAAMRDDDAQPAPERPANEV